MLRVSVRLKTRSWPWCLPQSGVSSLLEELTDPPSPLLASKMRSGSLSASAVLLLYSGSAPPLSRSALCCMFVVVYLFIFFLHPYSGTSRPPALPLASGMSLRALGLASSSSSRGAHRRVLCDVVFPTHIPGNRAQPSLKMTITIHFFFFDKGAGQKKKLIKSSHKTKECK